MKYTNLARELGMSRQNLNSVFHRKSIDIELLQQLSEALDYNFFEALTPKRLRNRHTRLTQSSDGSQRSRVVVQIYVDDPITENEVLELVLPAHEVAYVQSLTSQAPVESGTQKE